MLFHVSIPADHPENVARVVTELWRGTMLPFPPVPGAFMVWLGDEQRTILEVHPRGHEHVPAVGEFGTRRNPAPSPYSEAHVALGTPLSAEAVLAIGKREGWYTQLSNRGGLFAVIELWLEDKFLLEVLPETEQRRYAELTVDRLKAAFALDSPRGDAP
jgi:hypothetical protein